LPTCPTSAWRAPAGIIHRDLKPGNILLDRAGTFAHLSDFGLARPGGGTENLTVEGELLGTPSYMAPEQARGQVDQVGPWTDLYSLGVVLYQMLTGRLPFEGLATLGVLHKIASEAAPPPSQFRDDLDPDLEAVVQKALARRPEDRYRKAGALVEALDRWAAAAPAPHGADTRARADGPVAPTHAGPVPPAATGVAEPAPPVAGKEQTVTLSGLPDGQSLQLSLPAGARADVKVTMTGGEPGKRAKKKRPWRVTVSISLSVAALLLAVGLPIYLNSRGGAPTGVSLEREKYAAAKVGVRKSRKDGLRDKDGRSETLVKKASFPPGAVEALATHYLCLQLVEARPEGEVVTEVPAQIKGDRLVADLPAYLRTRVGGERPLEVRFADLSPDPVPGEFKDGKFIASWSRKRTAEALALSFLRPARDGRTVRNPYTVGNPYQDALEHNAYGAYGLYSRVMTQLPVGVIQYRVSAPATPPTLTVTLKEANALALPRRDAAASAAAVGLLRPDASPGPRLAALALVDRVGRRGQAPVPLLIPARLNRTLLAQASRQLNRERRQNAFLSYRLPANVTTFFRQHAGSVNSVVFSPDGKRLACAVVDSGVRLWDAATGKPLQTFKGRPGWVSEATFSPNGKWVAVGYGDGVVQCWDVPAGKKVHTLRAHTGRVNAIRFSPDGKYLVSGAEDRTAKVWDVAAGKEVWAFAGQRAAVTNLAFSPDGRLLAAANKGGEARLLDLTSGKAVGATPWYAEPIREVTFTSDGLFCVLAGENNTLHVCEVPPLIKD
jgi:hypothetical protein